MTDDDSASLQEIAAELYAGPPGAFVATRNARAKETTDRQLAMQLKALRKPSAAAWVVNVFAQERIGQLAQALRLADELREAQESLDAVALAELGRDRRALTRRLAAEAVDLASSRGERVTAATQEAVELTLTAAFFDRDASRAIASGRLVHALEPSTPVDLVEAVGGGAPGALQIAEVPADEVAARRVLRQAQAVLHDAERAQARAAREHVLAQQEAQDAVYRAAEKSARVVDLEEELAAARAAANAAHAGVESAEARAVVAAEQLTATEDAVQAAREALEHLDQRRDEQQS